MTIALNYENYKLGELSFDGEEYCYNSFLEDESKAIEIYITMRLYNLRNSKDLRSKELFQIFRDILKDNSRHDIYQEAEIKESDNDFEKLCKLAKLNLTKRLFYITLN